MRVLALTAFIAFAATPAFAALQSGTAAPQFKAQASLAGKEFTYSLADALKKGPVVVYFYPSAFTGGCNIQAHEFSQNIDKFKAAGASVVGVSLDNIQRLNEFSKDPEYCAGKLPVASDAGGSIAKSYDVQIISEFNGKSLAAMEDSRGQPIGHDAAERLTFIVTPDGKIAQTIGGMKVAPKDNVMQALAAVQGLAKK